MGESTVVVKQLVSAADLFANKKADTKNLRKKSGTDWVKQARSASPIPTKSKIRSMMVSKLKRTTKTSKCFKTKS
jgi:hypothetical protein